MKKIFLSLFLLLLTVSVLPLCAWEITADAVIAVSEKGHAAEKLAAKDLQHWIKEISGKEVPVVICAAAPAAPAILVGHDFAEKEFADDLRTLDGTDGFAIRAKGNKIYLFGGEARSAFYAVTTLLEKNSDLIFARPAVEYGTVFSKNPALKFDFVSTLEKPAFKFHGWNVVGTRRDEPTGLWTLRNFGNWACLAWPAKGDPGIYDFLPSEGGHVYWWMAHPDKYFKTNPEFFGYSRVSGKREPHTLCLTNPMLHQVAVENLKIRLKGLVQLYKTDHMAFGLGFRDAWTMCECDSCLAPIRLPDGTELKCKNINPQQDPKYFSTRYWLFINKLVEALQPEFPNFIFRGSAYFYAAEPPACELNQNLHVGYCPIGGVNPRYPLLHEKQSPVWRKRLEAWNKIAPGRLVLYEYYRSYASGFATVSGTSTIEQKIVHDLRHTVQMGNQGITCELTPDSERIFSNHTMKSEWDANSVSAWILARLFWNPDQDPRALRDYYLERTFREASDLMKQFYDMLDLGYKKSGDVRLGFLNTIVNTGLERPCLELLERAEKAAVHPTSKTLIRRMIAQWKSSRDKMGVRNVPTMAREEGYQDFGATCYETALIMPEFRVPSYFNWGARKKAASGTEVRVVTDGKNLYFRFKADGPGAVFLPEKIENDVWPLGDAISCKISIKKKPVYTFVFDGRGKMYDVRGGSKSWNSTAKLKTTIDPDGWRAILTLPLEELGIDLKDRNTYPALEMIRYINNGKIRQETTLGGEFPGRFSKPLMF